MQFRLLIDEIVRQTTVLLAQLSTASGVRAPLSHVADQVFLELAREIEAQGVKRQVVADMFGLALRSYQKKMQRLSESSSERGRTLWEVVLSVVEAEQPTRARLLERFERDGEREVASVLNDLVQSGLVSVTGSGSRAVYSPTSEATRRKLSDAADEDAIGTLAWLKVFRGEASTREELLGVLAVEASALDRALGELLASARLTERGGRLTAANLVVPLGAEHGWEAAVLDHFRTVTVAIARKVRDGVQGSRLGDRIGGSTFTFTVQPGHPFEGEVLDLLRRTRVEVLALWERVAAHNREHPPPDTARRVSFYFGQTIEMADEAGEETAS